jgi:deazaflavin-dependent oxidoreductase (nitroreductase family)
MLGSTVLGAAAAAGAALATVVAVEREFGPAGLDRGRALRDGLRSFNRAVFNPLVLQLARLDGTYPAVVSHVGRRSGRPYRTPVAVAEVAQGFLVPLPYGEDTDWRRNVQAAGGCTLRWAGRDYVLGHPEVLAADRALAMVDPWRAALWGRFGISRFLLLRREAPHESIAA